MPSETGYWSPEEAKDNHDFSYLLAKYIGQYFPKEEALIDYGAGNGFYVRYLHDIGFENVRALEGDVRTITEIGSVIEQDLAIEFNLEDKAINGICLEVGEHLSEEHLDVFFDNICNNTLKTIIMSWAIPNQQGYKHISCRHNIWVVGEMEKRGWKLLVDDSIKIRGEVEERLNYFRSTLMIFKKINE